MTVWFKNYLGDPSQPWARQVQKEIDNSKSAFQTAEVNNVKRDAQLQSSLRQVQSASTAASQAAIDAANAAAAAASANSTAIAANNTAISANSTAITANSNAIAALQDIVDLGSEGGPAINAANITAGTINGINIIGTDITGTSTITGAQITGGSISGATVAASGTVTSIGGFEGPSVNTADIYATQSLTIEGNSDLQGRIISAGTYNAVASSTANVLINVNNFFQRTTSSRRYKSDIQDIDYGIKGLELQPRSWVDKAAYEENGNSIDGLTRITGFIAEEVHELGLTELVQYNEDGLPEAVNYDRITVALIPVLNQQQALIESLTARIEALENKVQ